MNKLKKKDNSDKVDDNTQNSNDLNIKNNINSKNKIFNSEKILDNKEIIFDMPVEITIELGRSKIKIKELLNFSEGSMFFLNQHKDDPLKIFANGKLVALGEIVKSNDIYGVRIISIKNSLNTMN